MEIVFDTVRELLLNSTPLQSLMIVFITLYLGCIGVPVNSDLVLLFTGVLTSFGHFESYQLIPVCIFGIFLGDVCLYAFCKKMGPKVLKFKFFKRIISIEKLGRVERLLEKYGRLYILFIRLFPGTRSASFVAISVLQFPIKTFAIFNFVAVILWSNFVHFLGIYAGNNYKLWILKIQGVQANLLLAILSLLALYLLRVYLLKKTKGPSQENL